MHENAVKCANTLVFIGYTEMFEWKACKKNTYIHKQLWIFCDSVYTIHEAMR